MARPMVLMQPDLLEAVWYKYAQGVPVLALIRQFNLDGRITAPTLTKLLTYYAAAQDGVSEEVANIIYDSLFPSWLLNHEAIVATNPSHVYYTGKMPLGNWVNRNPYTDKEGNVYSAGEANGKSK